ncbi:DUF4123 domain-containing protein [Pseudomonas sp. 14P_8.1_Bac3]|uniref:DUF4123 domain-containing protein n=1 Tax=Pseudomonas sp. 14P_8.1_Bac3 TaxID=2971621 RepID=UPI0021CA1D8A|nr:DUF4123 domain-containing protein [Pseudomonas sp. 14P_8.1_Bac3]MCU1763851.1 DUF4123 domain-containing protein [Pseudomonas sp. 14P_8.1_Bac3]
MIGAPPQWLLLDVPGAPQAKALLQQTFPQARCFWLFEDTELQALREDGPALIDLRTCPALAESCYSQTQVWRGLLIVSEASSSQLLEHLRRMLTVTIGLHHRAVLSYYNPNTASYFFDACDALELSRWLGPINRLHWFGGTWADRAIGSQGWQHLLNPELAVSPLAVEESLSPRQREKLQTCLLEQHAWHWNQATGTDYHRLWAHVQEGLMLGFRERPVLDGWLWLRLQYPRASLVQPLSGRTQQERLENLRNRWQNDQP